MFSRRSGAMAMLSLGFGLGSMLAASGGCAHKKPVVAAAPARVKMAVMPVESEAFPDLARQLNDALVNRPAPGVDENFRARVTLEVVQLSIECVEPTSACYAAAGRSLGAQRLLFAHVVPGKSRHRREKPVSVAITYFDVERQAPVRVVERAFKRNDEAVKALPSLVAEAVAAPGPGDGDGMKKAATP